MLATKSNDALVRIIKFLCEILPCSHDRFSASAPTSQHTAAIMEKSGFSFSPYILIFTRKYRPTLISCNNPKSFIVFVRYRYRTHRQGGSLTLPPLSKCIKQMTTVTQTVFAFSQIPFFKSAYDTSTIFQEFFRVLEVISVRFMPTPTAAFDTTEAVNGRYLWHLHLKD